MTGDSEVERRVVRSAEIVGKAVSWPIPSSPPHAGAIDEVIYTMRIGGVFKNPGKLHLIHQRRKVASVNEGNKKLSLGMALGIAVGMILYRLILG